VKSAIQSKTIWSAIVVIVSVVANLLGDMGVIDVSEGLRQGLQTLAGIGGAGAIYGRLQADSEVTITGK